MIQIIVCHCAKQRFREANVSFHFQEEFYDYIEDIFVVPCERHPLFKQCFGGGVVDVKCSCLHFDKGRCNNCKTRCFNLNFVADKIKAAEVANVSAGVKLMNIKDYLWDIKILLCFYFCFKSFKVYCNLDNPELF